MIISKLFEYFESEQRYKLIVTCCISKIYKIINRIYYKNLELKKTLLTLLGTML